jgi:hypothetical protein
MAQTAWRFKTEIDEHFQHRIAFVSNHHRSHLLETPVLSLQLPDLESQNCFLMAGVYVSVRGFAVFRA